MKKIVTIMSATLVKRCAEQLEIELVIRDSAKEYIVEHAYEPKYGARPLRRKIREEIEDKLAEELLDGKIQKGDKVVVTTKNKKIVLDTTKK